MAPALVSVMTNHTALKVLSALTLACAMLVPTVGAAKGKAHKSKSNWVHRAHYGWIVKAGRGDAAQMAGYQIDTDYAAAHGWACDTDETGLVSGMREAAIERNEYETYR